MKSPPRPWSTEVAFVYIHLYFCNFYLNVYFIGTISSLVCEFPISLQKAHNVCWGALYSCGCKINCVNYTEMLTDSKLPSSLRGCLLLLHHTPDRLKHCSCSFCPSIWLADLKEKTLFKHNTQNIKNPHVSGLSYEVITGTDVRILNNCQSSHVSANKLWI